MNDFFTLKFSFSLGKLNLIENLQIIRLINDEKRCGGEFIKQFLVINNLLVEVFLIIEVLRVRLEDSS